MKKTITLLALFFASAFATQAQLELFSGNDGKYGIKNNADGKIIVSALYNELGLLNDDILWGRKGNDYYFIDTLGKEKYRFDQERMHVFDKETNQQLYCVYNKDAEGIYGLINSEFKEIVPLKMNYCTEFNEGRAKIVFYESGKGYGRTGYVDYTGRFVIPQIYDWGGDFSDGLAVISLNKKYGFIDKSGKEIIPVKYESAEKFTYGLAPVKINGKWGYVDKTGKMIIPAIYDVAINFAIYGGVKKAIASRDGKYFEIDTSGNILREK